MPTQLQVPVRIPTRHRDYLRETFESCRDGIEADLQHPERLADPERSQRDADAYGRLLAALDSCAIVPDADLRRVSVALLDSVDGANEYTRVVAEHRALCTLVDQLDGRCA
jgi:hypothetical protein